MVFLPVADEDAGKNGEFDCSYENTQPSEFGKFQVLTTAGGCEVQNKILLKWFEGSLYSLRVRVTDKAPPLVRKSDVVTVTIKVRWLEKWRSTSSLHIVTVGVNIRFQFFIPRSMT